MSHEAITSPHHLDPTLRGRRYAIPFEQVWSAALQMASSTSRWEVVEVDDLEGRLRIEARSLLFGGSIEVEILVRLDGDAQTRVDLISRTRSPNFGLGTQARRVRKILENLDRALGASRAVVLPPHEGAEFLPELTPL